MWAFRRYIHKIGLFISNIVLCDESLTTGGNNGIYELDLSLGTGVGLAGIKYNAQGIPDRFQLIYNGNIVADSLYVGDQLTGTPPNYPGLLGEKNLPVYSYTGAPSPNTWEDTGVIETFTITPSDVADRVNQPTNGNGTLLFNKTTAEPSVVTIRVIGATGGTSWNLSGICPFPEETAIDGTYKVINGFFQEPQKGTTTVLSSGVVLGNSPVKFYTNLRGDVDFNTLGWTISNSYINDGTFWWQIDPQGNILDTGVL